MKKIITKTAQEIIVAKAAKSATKKDFASLKSVPIDHLCGCK